MEFALEAISGYLQKASGASWADLLTRDPLAYAGGDLYVGKRYWINPKQQTRNWRLWRSFLSFETSELARLNQVIRDAYLEFQVKFKGAAFRDLDSIQIFSHGSAPWGQVLDPGDWDKCNAREGFFTGQSLSGIVRFLMDPSHINKTGQTQFRLRLSNEFDAPTGDHYAVFYGANSGKGVRLVAHTGYINDDIPTTLAEEIFPPWQAQLGVTKIHAHFLPHVTNPPEIQIGWSRTTTAANQQVAVDVDYIDRVIPAGSATAPLYNLDEKARKKADLIRRILLMHRDCKGLATGIQSIEEAHLLEGEHGKTDLLQGARITVVYDLPHSVEDDVTAVNEGV